MTLLCLHDVRILVTSLAFFCAGMAKASPTLPRHGGMFYPSTNHVVYTQILPAWSRQAEFPAVDVPSHLNPYPDKPRLTFSSSGTFKLTVFSDLHYGENPWDDWGPQQDVNSTRLMRSVLAAEKPDYVYGLCSLSSQLDASNDTTSLQHTEWRLDHWRKCAQINLG